MILSLLRHALLIMTFRHKGGGLPRRSLGLVLLVLFGSALVAVLARGEWWYGFGHLIALLIVCRIVSPAVASGCALISIAIDLLRIVVGGDYGMALSIWEVTASIVFGVRCANATDAAKPQPVVDVVEIRFSPVEIVSIRPAMVELVVMQRLKDAGVPVVGSLRFGGISRGMLERWDDAKTGDVVFRWSSRGIDTSA